MYHHGLRIHDGSMLEAGKRAMYPDCDLTGLDLRFSQAG